MLFVRPGRALDLLIIAATLQACPSGQDGSASRPTTAPSAAPATVRSGEALAPSATPSARAPEPTDAWARDAATATDPDHRPAGLIVRWPRQAASPLYVAMLNDRSGRASGHALWMERAADGAVGAYDSLAFTGDAPPSAVFPLDVTGDGEAELVVLGAPDASTTGAPWPQTVHVYAVFEPGRSPPVVVERPRLGWLLSPASTEAEVRAAAPAARSFAPPDATTPTERLLLRLQDASREQALALIAPGGLSACQTREGNARPHSRRCRRFLPARLADPAAWREVRAALGYFDTPAADADPGRPGARALPPPSCRRRGAREVCAIILGGPAGIRWTFVGAGAARRLAEVDEYQYENE